MRKDIYMKKFRIVILSVILGLLLCACGKEPVYTEAQTQRMNNAGSIATSYGINILEAIAQQPDLLFSTPYTDFTYDELETIMRDYVGFNVDGYALANAIDSFDKGLAETGAILRSWKRNAGTRPGRTGSTPATNTASGTGNSCPGGWTGS